MSAQSRDELLRSIRPQYAQASRAQKTVILDSLVAATGLSRKHATSLLTSDAGITARTRTRSRKYDDDVATALRTVWKAANRICSRRLIPFLPELVDSLERFGHLNLSDDVRFKLLSMSVATADRILKKEKAKFGKSRSLTKPGHLIKKQIELRTFADWNDVSPGFFESDLVAHCGDNVHGQFLNTMTMTDIATGWTELVALLRRSEADVIHGLEETKRVLPFSMLGFDTDNGGEFINYEVLGWCERNNITFTRSREYRKNDQCHVEEKNGSIVRRLIGYDRYEGEESRVLMAKLYRVARLYINFFQPCLKLDFKERDGAKVRKHYKDAATPLNRLLDCDTIAENAKKHLREMFAGLDPVKLLEEMESLQKNLWQTAIKRGNPVPKLATEQSASVFQLRIPGTTAPEIAQKIKPKIAACYTRPEKTPGAATRDVRKSSKPVKLSKVQGRPVDPTAARMRTGRKTEVDAVQDEIVTELSLNPKLTTSQLLEILMKRYPGRFRATQRSTLYCRIRDWRMSQLNVTSSADYEPKLYRAEPNWKEVHGQIKERRATRRELWKEYVRDYRAIGEETYHYSQFCRRLCQWLERSHNQVAEPDWPAVHVAITQGATRFSLWQTYVDQCEKTEMMSHTYNNFCRRYLLWLGRNISK